MFLKSVAPVLPVLDVGATARWYTEHLGFKADLFFDGQPYEFAILTRESVEIMLRRCGTAVPTGDWDMYIRMDGVSSLFESVSAVVHVVEPLRTKPYCQLEFTIEDVNGFRLVFGEAQ